MNYKKLQKLALQEAEKLREYATPEQKARLNVYNFNPQREHACIYGLMTGSCETPEAHELARHCTTGLFDSEVVSEAVSVSGSSLQEFYDGRRKRRERGYFTPLEVYIYDNYEDGLQLLKYIKGEIAQPKLTDL